METSDTPATPRRRLRRVLLVLVLAIVIIGALIVGFLPAIISNGLPGWIAASVADNVDAETELDTATLSWTGDQSIEGLRLKERRPDGTTATVLSVRRITIRNSLLDIVGGGASALTVEIDEPVIEAHRSKEGELNWARLLRIEDASAEDSGREEPPPSDTEPDDREPRPAGTDRMSWELERSVIVRVRDGSIRYRDDALSTTSNLESCTVDLALDANAAKAELAARVVQPGSEAPPGDVRWSGGITGLKPSFRPEELSAKAEGAIAAVDLTPYRGVLKELADLEAPVEPVDGRFTVEMRDGKLFSAIELDAGFLSLARSRLPEGVELGETARASLTELTFDSATEKGRGALELTGDLRYQGYRTRRVAAGFEISERQLVFRDVNADLNGGRLVAPRLSLDLTGEKPGYQLQLGVEDVEANFDTSSLLAYVVPFLALEDRQGTLSGRITASLELRGRGFEVADLETLEGNGEFRLRDGQFQGSRFFREVSRLVGTDLDRVAFSELGSDFRFSAGKIASDNVFLKETREKLRNIGLKGTTTVRGELDYGVDLAALQETVGDRGIRDVLRGVEAVLGKDGFPIRLGGTLKEPRLTWGAAPERKDGKGAGGLLDKILRQ